MKLLMLLQMKMSRCETECAILEADRNLSGESLKKYVDEYDVKVRAVKVRSCSCRADRLWDLCMPGTSSSFHA